VEKDTKFVAKLALFVEKLGYFVEKLILVTKRLGKRLKTARKRLQIWRKRLKTSRKRLQIFPDSSKPAAPQRFWRICGKNGLRILKRIVSLKTLAAQWISENSGWFGENPCGARDLEEKILFSTKRRFFSQFGRSNL
jgi:hypothetical protein